MELTLKEIVASDLSEILELAESVNEEHVIPCLNPEGQQTMRRVRRSDIEQVINKDVYTAIKAVAEGRIIGYVAWRQGRYIAQLYVSTEYQGLGIGRQLVTEMQRISGAETIELKASINAVGFYEKLGFKATEEELESSGIRYVPMKRVI
ncbi:MAG: GNAT family N-acetyltransferase [Endozoicomonas sp.]|uniref:GNAT family N-acetyltransferase n=1 Tax=Endozoicomonas sp. TaxID=1892382 RepID=UPI003D9B915C